MELCKHGYAEKGCPWPPCECPHASLNDIVMTEVKRDFYNEYNARMNGYRLFYPSILVERKKGPYGWGWVIKEQRIHKQEDA